MNTEPTSEQLAHLLTGLREGVAPVRKAAAVVLGAFEPDPELVLPALVQALRDEDVHVRLEVAFALQNYGKRAEDVLVESLREAVPEDRQALFQTLGLLAESSRSARRHLERLGRHEEWGPAARHCLANLRPRPINWNPFVDSVGRWVLLLGFVLEIANEVFTWIGFFGPAQGLAMRLALAWGAIGGYLGAVCGARLRGPAGMRRGAKYLSLGGACTGAVVGQMAGALIEPLVRHLGSD